MDLDAALKAGNDDAVDDALDLVKSEQGALGLSEALLVVILQKRQSGTEEHELTGYQYRRAAALEAAAVVEGTNAKDAAERALEAAALARDVLNDGEGATRALILALRLSADDDGALKSTVATAGGDEPAVALLEKAAKKAKGDDVQQGKLRRALARTYEVVLGDKEKAFFEALKAARKIPEGLYIDDVYRLALDVKRLDEAAAFFQSIGDEVTIAPRARASALNKLGAVQEAKSDKNAAFNAYLASLSHHETKAARKKAERLRDELELATEIPPPVEAKEPPPKPAPPPPKETSKPVKAATTTTTLEPPAPEPTPEPQLSKPEPEPEQYEPKTAPKEEEERFDDPDVVEERLAKAMDPNMATHVGPPPVMPAADIPSIPPPLPPDDEEVGSVGIAVTVAKSGDPASDALAAARAFFGEDAAAEFDRPVFTDELKVPAELSADDAEVVSEERVDPKLRARAVEEDSLRSPRPSASTFPISVVDDELPPPTPPAPPDDEASLLVVRGDPTVEKASMATQTMPPAPPTALPSDLLNEAMPPPTPSLATPELLLLDEASRSLTRPVVRGTPVEAPLTAPPSPVSSEPDTGPTRAAPGTLSEVSEISDRKKPKAKQKKQKKPRRGHSVDNAEVTAPASSVPPDVTLEAQPSSEAPSMEMARPGDPMLSLGDALPEPAMTAPGGGNVSLADERALRNPAAPGSDEGFSSSDEIGGEVKTERARPQMELSALDEMVREHSLPSQEPSGAYAFAAAPGDERGTDKVETAPEVTDPKEELSLRSAPAPSLEPPSEPSSESEPSVEEPRPPTRDELLAKAQALLASDAAAVDELLAVAFELQGLSPGDPRVLRLAARALLLEAPAGALSGAAVALVVADATRHGERAATLIRDVQQALPAPARTAYGELWLAGAKAAGHDVDAVHALLEEVAGSEAGGGPDGALFTFLDDALKDASDVDRRDTLHLRAWRAAAADEVAGDARRIKLTRARIALLEDARKDSAALAAWAQLVTEHPVGSAPNGVDAATRNAARRAHEKKATPDERARFLSRLARVVADKEETASVLRELLELRVAVDDKVGAEATARELLLRVPGDARATTVLADLLADDPRRAVEVVAALRARADAAAAGGDNDGARQALERLARAYTSAERPGDAAAALVEAVKLAPGDQALVERVLDSLLVQGRVSDAVDLLEDLAGRARAEVAARLLLRGAGLAREKLAKRGRARELVEKAVLLQPKDLRVLDAHAELLLEIGDAGAALAALEKIAAEEKEAPARARVHLRIGKLLEEHLLRADDALKRYRAAVETDRNLREGWEALHQLARQKGDKDAVVDGLTGLAALQSGRDRAQTLVKLGRVHFNEKNDPTAAAAAYEAGLAASAADIDALTGLLQVRALALQGERDVDAAVAVPAPELVDEMYRPLMNAEAQGAQLPFGFRRLLALAVTQDGDRDGAHKRFEALLEERGDDLPTLLAFARHLAAAQRLPSSTTKPGALAIADARRREVLETVLLHHAYALKPTVHVDVWGEVCALRLQQGDVQGAKKAAKKALALVTASERPVELEDALSDRAVRSFVMALEDEDKGVDAADVDVLEQAIAFDLRRAIAPSEKAKLKEKQAKLALTTKKDAVLARQLLEEALQHDPDASTAREMLFDLELEGEDPRSVLDQSRALVARERDPQKKAQLHLRLFRLQKKLRMQDDVAAVEIKAAVELDPKNTAILDAAEKFFTDKKDGKGLDALYTTRLKSLDRGDVPARLVLLERLAQLRRYELRDLRAAIDACEAMSALDPDAIKPREDAARLHVELGQWKEAVYAWRAVLDRDTLLVEAWRGLFSVYARSRQADDAFAVAATMAALEIADDDMTRAVRAVRPPFPRWPLPPADATSTKKKLAHPMERTAVRAVLEVVAPRLLPRLGRPLQDFGVRRRDALVEQKLPASVAMALRTAAALAGFPVSPGQPLAVPVYQAELGATDGTSPPFAALPAKEPGLIVTSEVLRGGMTPERAFALGRAMAWLSPWALLAASLDAAEIRRLLEGLVAAFLSPRDVEKPSADIDRHGAEVQKELFAGLSTTEQDALRATLMPALRDWTVARGRTHLSDWKAGVGYTGDRLGFLLSSDLPAAVKVIRSAGGSMTGVRLAIRELVLFTISPQYLQLRKELSLLLPEQALAPILDLG